MYLVTHGDHGTNGCDKIDQKTKNVVNTGFFLRLFFPTHFDHQKLRKSFWWWWVGGENDSRVISLVKESKLLTFSYLNESDLESTLTSLDQELDNIKDTLETSFRTETFQWQWWKFKKSFT